MISSANPAGVSAVVSQQFEVGHQILSAGLVPIIEPEVDIHAPDKAEAEEMLRDAILNELATVDTDLPVMLKLTLPEVDGLYDVLVHHDSVARVVALSGGYSREVANERLAKPWCDRQLLACVDGGSRLLVKLMRSLMRCSTARSRVSTKPREASLQLWLSHRTDHCSGQQFWSEECRLRWHEVAPFGSSDDFIEGHWPDENSC